MTRLPIATVLAVVSDLFDVPVHEIVGRGAGRTAQQARRVAAWASIRWGNRATHRSVGRALGREPEAIRSLAQSALRRDVGLDGRVDAVARRLDGLAAAPDLQAIYTPPRPPRRPPRVPRAAIERLAAALTRAEADRFGPREKSAIDELMTAAKAVRTAFKDGVNL